MASEEPNLMDQDVSGQEIDYHRVTLSIPAHINRQLRHIQGKIIVEEGRQCSYNEVLLRLIVNGLSMEPSQI